MSGFETVETYEVRQERDVHSDAGDSYAIKCPKCGDTFIWTTSAWCRETCSCGFRWDVEIKATGYKWTE